MDVDWPHGEAEDFTALYRIAFETMEVPGLAREHDVAGVFILHTRGPVETRWTDIVQRPEARLIWDKTTYFGVQKGAGLPLTIGHLPVVIPRDTQPPWDAWRGSIYSSVGLLAALLDERVAQRQIFDDFLVFDDGEWTGTADSRLRTRRFLPFEITSEDEQALAQLADRDEPADVLTAARFYLRAAQPGLTADGIAFFWIALEAVAGSEGRRVVPKVEDALREEGHDPQEFEPSIGRLFGLRADVVHRGLADTEFVTYGWYTLERVCRLLLRARLGITSTWPAHPGDRSYFPPDVQREIEAGEETPETAWHEPGEWA